MKSYEEICALLDETLRKLDDESTPLMELVESYKKATALLESAQKMLKDASKSIEIISQDGEANSMQIDDTKQIAGAGAQGFLAQQCAGGSLERGEREGGVLF